MAGSCKFAFAVHILAVLAYKRGLDVTSDVLAASVNTNPVVIRRLLCVLRCAGLIATHKGPRGGARLAAEPGEISLARIYDALQQHSDMAAHPQEPNQCCPVGRKIQTVLEDVFREAEEARRNALAKRTLADVLETVEADPA